MFSRLPHSLSCIGILLLIITCPSCSVKEDRDLCPCMLELAFGQEDRARLEEGIYVTLHGYTRKGIFRRCDTVILDGDLIYRTTVPSGILSVASAYLPEGGAAGPLLVDAGETVPAGEGKWLSIRKGHECPVIWSSHLQVDTRGEESSADASLHKNYCNITISLTGNYQDGIPFRLELRSNVDGYLLDGSPSDGEFIAAAVCIDDVFGMNVFSVRVPRQTDDMMKLDIISEDEYVRTFALGNYIQASGYDWTSPDLKDIHIEIDYARTSAIINIDKWSTTVHFETVI